VTFLAVIAVIAAIVWSLFVVAANGMSDAPSAGFQGGDTIVIAWLIAAVFVAARIFG
jgi:hypothetical protein